MSYDEMAKRCAELREWLAKNPSDWGAQRELDRLLDNMHPGGW